MARTRPHFKVHTTVLYHKKMSGLISDNELFGLWVKLGVLAVERYAAKNDNQFTVSHSELLGLTGRKRIDKALLVVSKLVDNSPLTVSYLSHSVSFEFPNLLKKQGFHPKKVQTSAPTYTNTNTNTNTNGNGRMVAEIRVTESDIGAMIAVRPGGAIYSAREVGAWVKWISPQIALREASDPKALMLSWWPNVTWASIDKAIKWAATVSLSKKVIEPTNIQNIDVDEVPADIFRDTVSVAGNQEGDESEQ